MNNLSPIQEQELKKELEKQTSTIKYALKAGEAVEFHNSNGDLIRLIPRTSYDVHIIDKDAKDVLDPKNILDWAEFRDIDQDTVPIIFQQIVEWNIRSLADLGL